MIAPPCGAGVLLVYDFFKCHNAKNKFYGEQNKFYGHRRTLYDERKKFYGGRRTLCGERKKFYDGRRTLYGERKKFYDAHVALVYGGGARNNAEFFIPSVAAGKADWSRRRRSSCRNAASLFYPPS